MTILVLTGPAGAGKTVVGRAVAARLGWRFEDGDDHHPAGNVSKMEAGVALTDSDREPWLAALARLIDARVAEGADMVLACSALKRAYRARLSGPPQRATHVRFAHLDVPPEILRARMRRREGHFMPESLLASQLETLETPSPEEAWIIPAAGTVEETVEAVLSRLEDEASHP